MTSAAEIFLLNDRLNQLVIEHLDPAAWTAKPPGKARTIAAIFTHMHNVRCKWVRLTAPHITIPPQLTRSHCTMKQAGAGLKKSAAACAKMLSDSSIKTFHRDGWAKPWPVGPNMLAYMLTHEAHHRGQACMLAHQLGCPLRTQDLWNWEKVSKEL